MPYVAHRFVKVVLEVIRECGVLVAWKLHIPSSSLCLEKKNSHLGAEIGLLMG